MLRAALLQSDIDNRYQYLHTGGCASPNAVLGGSLGELTANASHFSTWSDRP
jgi:hypothetical protein